MQRILAATLFGTVAVASAGSASAQQPTGKLPMAPGAWIMANESCATTRYVNLYDGQRWGSVSFFTENANERPAGGLNAITRTRNLKSGFSEVWIENQWGEPGDRSDWQVRPATQGRVTYRTVSPDTGRIQSNGGRDIITDVTLKRCEFAALPARMQKAVREFAPGLDPRAGLAASAPGALATGLRWSRHNFPDGPAAGAAGPRSLTDFYVRCRSGVPVIETMYMGGSKTLNVGLTGQSSRVSVNLTFAPRQGNAMTWQARLPPQAIALLKGNDPALLVTVNGKPDGELSLMDARTALAHVAGQCPALGIANAAPAQAPARSSPAPAAAAAPSNAMPAPVGLFNIAPGYYVEAAYPCHGAGGPIFYYDGRRWGYLDLGGYRANAFFPVSKSRKTKRGWMIEYSQLVVQGPGRILIIDDNEMVGSNVFRWCPTSQIPRGQRVPG